MSEVIKLVVKEPPANIKLVVSESATNIRLVTENIIVREVAAEAGTLFILVDGSLGEDTATGLDNLMITNFLITAPSGTSISAGRTLGGTEIFEQVTTNSRNYYIESQNLFDESTIYFDGVTTQTKIYIFYNSLT